MHVAVDAGNLTRDKRGIGRYVRAMLARFLDHPNLRITLLVPDVFRGAARARIARTLGRNDVEVRHRNSVGSVAPDLVWYPWNGMTWTSPVASVATVHDVWPFVSPARDLATRRREQTAYFVMAARTQGIIANSRFTKREIARYLSVADNRIHVVYMGVDMPQGIRTALRLRGVDRYVLAVGEDEPRKDLATLRRAMPLLPGSLRRTTGLVIAGKSRSKSDGGGVALDAAGAELTLDFAATDGMPSLVTGEVSDAVLDQLYAHAAAFAFPSTYEGFGLVALEAMAHGIPVVAADAASIPEVVGDAALYFPPGRPDALAQGLVQVMTDAACAATLAGAGRIRAREFSWDRTAQATLEVFSKLTAGASL